MKTYKNLFYATAFVFTAVVPFASHASEVGDYSTVLDKLPYSYQYREAMRTGAVKGHGEMNYQASHDVHKEHRNYKLRF